MTGRPSHAFRTAAAAVAAAVAVGAAAWAASRPESYWFERPAKRLARATERFRENLTARDPGLRALWTFDGREAVGWFPAPPFSRSSDEDVDRAAFPGTSRVPGRHGDARRFRGDDGSFVLSQRDWKHGADAPLSLAMWLRLEPEPVRQDVLCSCEGGLRGLRVDGDRIVFDYRTESEARALAAPFSRDGGWRHAAVVAEPAPAGGRIAIYVDGALAAEEPLPSFPAFRIPYAFGCASSFRVRDPLRGDLDDVAVWSRALSSDEVRAIAKSSGSIAETLAAPDAWHRLVRARRGAALREALGRALSPRSDRGSRSPAAAPGLAPERVSLRFGTGELRHLLRAHERARRSGALTEGAARAVDGFLTVGGRSVRCRVSLHGAPSFYADSPRPSFAIDPVAPETALPGGARRLVLAPPESCGGLLPLAASLVAERAGLPVAPGCSVAELRVNGAPRGLYLARDFSRMGGAAGSGSDPVGGNPGRRRAARVVAAERGIVAPEDLPRDVASVARAFLSPDARADIAARLDAAEGLLCADGLSPLPPERRRSFLRAAGIAWSALPAGSASAAEAPLDATLFAGGNVSPFRVVSDLPLARAAASAAPGASLRFRSLAPGLLDDAGRIVRRPTLAPAEAPVEAVWRDAAGAERTEILRFRVMPERIRLPALSLWTGSPLHKLWRSDAIAEWYEPGPADGGAARVLPATAAGRGGLRLRGNTSYETPRKSLSLRTDVPHGFLAPGAEGRAIVVAGGLTDRLVLGNAFAFGLFRDFPPRADGGTNVAPRVRRAEGFVNGRYLGIRECVDRVDRDLPGSSRSTFFRHAVAAPRDPYMRPVHAPSRRAEAEAVAAFRDAERLASGPEDGESVETWAARVAARIDLGSAADLFLLSELVGNMNGHPRPFPFDEILRFDPDSGRFDYVPWDFDRTLRNPDLSAATDSDRRFLADLPGYRERVAERWRELRRGPCAAEALQARLEGLFAETAGCLAADAFPEESGKPSSPAAFKKLLLHCREVLAARAERLDGLFGPSVEEGQ